MFLSSLTRDSTSWHLLEGVIIDQCKELAQGIFRATMSKLRLKMVKRLLVNQISVSKYNFPIKELGLPGEMANPGSAAGKIQDECGAESKKGLKKTKGWGNNKGTQEPA